MFHWQQIMWGGSICLTEARLFYMLPTTSPDFPPPKNCMKVACLLITQLRAKVETIGNQQKWDSVRPQRSGA